MEDRKLTKKQKAFADYYLQNGNGQKSAIKAGYSERSARYIASENLTKPHIMKYIKKRMSVIDEEVEQRQVDVHDTLNKILEDAGKIDFTALTKEIKKYETVDEEGHLVEYTKETVPIKQSDLIRALELKAKLDGLFNEDSSEERTINIVTSIPNMIGAPEPKD